VLKIQKSLARLEWKTRAKFAGASEEHLRSIQ
jgi:hypothetical protein